MSIKKIVSIIFLLISLQLISQENFYNSSSIDPDLKKNANAIIRLSSSEITILSKDKMLVKNKQITTVLNSSGDSKVGAIYYYDENNKLKILEAKIYNAFGSEIKKIKKKDFKDVSATDGFSLYNDSRVKYLDYTPINYPYTVEYLEEYETSFTVAIPGWYPIMGYKISVEKSTYSIINSSGIETSIKTKNFEDYDIKNTSNQFFEANNIKAIKSESYSPSFSKFTPSVKVTLKNFNIEGVEGTNNNWSDFGKWMDDKLLKDTRSLPQVTIDEIKSLTNNAETDLDKAKIVYDYVQNKTRYISVQVGIGGWKPMLASDVDRLGYGDCKGLTNYTKTLLDEVGVESYYTVIYGDRDVRSIDKSFSSLQGNHVILCLPVESDYVWLECTSQTTPFGYNANFTDDRDALIITPEGGKIVHTKAYKIAENLLDTKAQITLDEFGNFNATVNSNSFGTQYGHHESVQTEDLKDQKLHYKDYWNYINNLEINNLEFKNNKDSIVFTEKLSLKATKYTLKTGDRLLLQPNFFNRIEEAPKRYVKRKLPFEVERGFIDIDEYEIMIPSTLEVEAVTQPVSIKNKFGKYSASVEEIGGKLIYKRHFTLNKGSYLKEEYKAFRKFWLDIIKSDKSKIVLKTKA